MAEIRYCDVSELTEEERWRLAGEVEARNTARRAKMTAEERRRIPPWETEDVPEDQQIILRKP
jgi:hypothetical protein